MGTNFTEAAGVGGSIDVEYIEPSVIFVPCGKRDFKRKKKEVLVFPIKFVCGKIFERGPLVPGKYKTAINIINVSETKVWFKKKVVFTFPKDDLSDCVDKKWVCLRPNEAIEIDCKDLFRKLDCQCYLGEDFIKGFVVLETVSESLRVAAVYTARFKEKVANGYDME